MRWSKVMIQVVVAFSIRINTEWLFLEIDSDGSGTVDFDGKKIKNKLINIFQTV